MTNEERLKGLEEQSKQAEVNFHQITGAIAIVKQMVEDEKNPKKEEKKK